MQKPENLRPAGTGQPVILIAEDEVLVQKLARITLEREGYFVLTAANGEVAHFLSQQFPGEIHLLLADVVMPKMGGVELCKCISAERPGVQTVLMSGHSFAQTINPAIPFLQKPFTPQDLRAIVTRLIPVSR